MRLFQKLSAMPCGRPATGQEEYTHIKLHKDTHRLWTERKRLLQLKSNNEVTLHFLNLPSASSSAVCVRSQEHRKIPIAQSIQFLRDRNIYSCTAVVLMKRWNLATSDHRMMVNLMTFST